MSVTQTPAEQMKAIRDGMARKAADVLQAMRDADVNGYPKPTETTSDADALDMSPQARLERVDAQLENETGADRDALLAVRAQIVAEMEPEPDPAKSLDDAIRDAEQRGDFKAAMSMKTQKLAALSRDQR